MTNSQPGSPSLQDTFIGRRQGVRKSAPITQGAAIPRMLFTPDDQPILAFVGDGGSLLLWNGYEKAVLSGRFAAAAAAALAERADATCRHLLAMVADRRTWLRGLAFAKLQPRNLGHLLLGEGLDVLFLELTERCNERCLHCYAEAEPERMGTLDMESVRRILGDARDLCCTRVQFTGGDPILHPHLPVAVATARELGFENIEIFTNGLRLSTPILERLRPFSPAFAFSVYSHEAATHDRITRTPGSHRRTATAIRRCLEAGFDVRVGIILMPENQGQEREIVRFLLEDLGLDAGSFAFDTVKGTGRGDYFDYAPDLAMSGMMTVDGAEEGHAPPTHARGGKLCVTASGDVYPCIFSRRTLLGNIHRQSLSGIVASLNHRRLPAPSAERWQRCRQSMSCIDCQITAYILGEGEGLAHA